MFESNVGRSVSWCCESWTLTLKEKQRLQTTERAMLRRFAGVRRSPVEDYLSWVVRATRSAELARESANLKSWVASVLERKWSWAGHVARMNEHRWASRLSSWRNHAWWQDQDQRSIAARPIRSRAGHFQRWETEILKFGEHIGWNSWSNTARAMDTAAWNERCMEFAQHTSRFLRRRIQ